MKSRDSLNDLQILLIKEEKGKGNEKSLTEGILSETENMNKIDNLCKLFNEQSYDGNNMGFIFLDSTLTLC